MPAIGPGGAHLELEVPLPLPVPSSLGSESDASVTVTRSLSLNSAQAPAVLGAQPTGARTSANLSWNDADSGSGSPLASAAIAFDASGGRHRDLDSNGPGDVAHVRPLPGNSGSEEDGRLRHAPHVDQAASLRGGQVCL